MPTTFSRIANIFLLAVLALAAGPAVPAFQPKPSQAKALQMRYLPIQTFSSLVSRLGLEGGTITALVTSPSDPRRMYAGTYSGGVYRSDDGGVTWQETNTGLGNLYIQSMVIHPTRPDIAYAGTYKSGVYRTTDGGNSWQVASSGLNREPIVYDMAIDPRSPDTLYAGTRSAGINPPWGGGVWKTTNAGQSWKASNSGLGEDWVYGLAVDPSNPSTVYAATHSQGIYKSVNGAQSWQAANNGISDLSARTIIVDPLHPQTLFMGTWHYGVAFKSTNGGVSWNDAHRGMDGVKVYKMFFDPLDPRNLYTATYLKGIYRSSDSGASWSFAGLEGQFITYLGVDRRQNTTIIAGTAGAGLYRTTLGSGQWTPSNRGLWAGNVYSLEAAPLTPEVLFAGQSMGGLARSQNGGESWQSVLPVNPSVWSLSAAPSNPAVVYAGTGTYGIFRSGDGGKTWQASNSGLASSAAKISQGINTTPRLPQDFAGLVEEESRLGQPAQPDAHGLPATVGYSIQSLAVDPNNPAVVYIGTDTSGVFKSTNSGSSWRQSGLVGKPVFALVIDPTRPHFIYAATDGASGTLWKSKDNGATWNQRYGGIQNLAVNALVVDPKAPDRLFCATTNGVFRSSDGGVNWQPAGLSGQGVYALKYLNGDLAAGAARGLYVSDDGGGTWANYSGEKNAVEVLSLAVTGGRSGTLLAGSRGRGAWSSEMSIFR